ncbi:MAG: HD domain-containing protein [Desulfobacter sp.]|nr:MAG: HD domain-containing protein [Desulfobacter sp.]
MEDYVGVRESQIYLYKDVPLYCRSKEGAYVLYKKAGTLLDAPRLSDKKHPELFIKKSDQGAAIKELVVKLNQQLAEQILSSDLVNIRTSLNLIIKEAFEHANAEALSAIPETIELMFKGFSTKTELVETLLKIKTTTATVIEHTVNVMLLTFRYGFFYELKEEDIKCLALCALFHDIGITEIDRKILKVNKRLTEKEFKEYATHPSKGCDLLVKQPGFDPLVATVAQEHHERIDGSGYPYGRTDACYESQLIGLIDCYEPLTYSEKPYRKAKPPFDSLQLIKEEVLQGKFSSKVFRAFSTSLTAKH